MTNSCEIGIEMEQKLSSLGLTFDLALEIEKVKMEMELNGLFKIKFINFNARLVPNDKVWDEWNWG